MIFGTGVSPDALISLEGGQLLTASPDLCLTSGQVLASNLGLGQVGTELIFCC